MAKTRATGNASLNDAATKVGAMLGRIAAKVDAVKRQRAEIAAELDHVIHVAQRMKADIGSAGGKGGGGRAPRRLSPGARARIANAARKRWAEYRKNKAKQGA